MPIGLDTGFFFALKENRQAQKIWMEGELVTSSVVMYEIQKRLLKGDFSKWETVIADIGKAVEVVPLTAGTALKAGHLAHGIGMHGFDALILASLLEAGCTDIYTLDEHFLTYEKRGVTIHLMGKE